MDAVTGALVGTLVGVLVGSVGTQVGNYLVQRSRQDHELKVKKLEQKQTKESDREERRRDLYAQFLDAANQAILSSGQPDRDEAMDRFALVWQRVKIMGALEVIVAGGDLSLFVKDAYRDPSLNFLRLPGVGEKFNNALEEVIRAIRVDLGENE